jgi:hypothetical protein
LLRPRRERPRRRRAAEQRDELAALHAGHGDFLPCRVVCTTGDPARSIWRRTASKSLGQT